MVWVISSIEISQGERGWEDGALPFVEGFAGWAEELVARRKLIQWLCTRE